MSRSVLAGLLVLLLAPIASAAPLPEFDLFSTAQRRVAPSAAARAAAARQLAPLGAVSSFEDRLGVPAFFWANPATTPVHALSLQGLAPTEAALQHLASHAGLYGLAAADALASLGPPRVHDLGAGAIVVSFEQRAGGVPVFRRRLNVIMNRGLELVALSGYLTPNLRPTGSFALADSTAFAVALGELSGQPVDPSVLLDAGLDEAGLHRFSTPDGAALHLGELARTAPVLYDTASALIPAWYVELEVSDGQGTDASMYGYVISAVDGQVLFRHALTQADTYTYRVWADSTTPFFPQDGPAGVGTTPHPTGKPDFYTPPFVAPSLVTLQNSPYSKNDPWLPPAATALTGNNVEAYADLVAPDGFSAGDFRAAASGAGLFTPSYDLTQSAGANATQRSAGLVQLFYTINFLHDWFYDHGFDEAAGDAQTNNFGRGGVGGDSIKGEAQDYGGTNNANMSTPGDGARPKMQMYLWRRAAVDTVITTPANLARTVGSVGAAFGPTTFSTAGALVLGLDASDALGPSTTDGCSALTNAAAVNGKIAVLDRGTCSFTIKTKNAQNAGAIGALFVNNVATPLPGMAGTDASILIPALLVEQSDGAPLEAALAQSTAISVTLQNSTLDRDGEIDNSVVAHEWGHYLSNRLIGNGAGLTSSQASGMGEGWSDFVAMLMVVRAGDNLLPNDASWAGVYALAGYAFGTAAPNNAYYYGIRRQPYSTDFTKNALTFKHIQDGVALPATVPTQDNGGLNSEVHNSGEIWATVLWEAYAAVLNDSRYTFLQARSRMQDYLVASLKATPIDPTFVEARDAWLAVALATDGTDYATLGKAFARRGLGTHAAAPDRAATDNAPVIEDFTFANELTFVSASLDDSALSCDHDGILDVGEKGKLHLTLRNTGPTSLGATTATLTSTTAGVTITPATFSLAASAPGGLTTGATQVTFTGLTTISVLAMKLTWTDPALPAGTRTQSLGLRVEADVLPASAAADDFEAPLEVWTPTRDTALSSASGWTRSELTPLQHVFFGVDPHSTADLSLVSPPLNVHPTQPFVITLSHRYDFEADGTNWDGAVIELSSNAGASWTDVGAAAGYTGALGGANSSNPLVGRQAYVGQSASYPAFVTQAISLGTAYAGKTVQVRLRIGADQAGSATGWEVDRIAFAGVVNTPFPSLVNDRHLCSNQGPVANAGPDLTVDERSTVVLDSSASTGAPGKPLTATWMQTNGPPVTLVGATFIAPEVSVDTDLLFSLVVSDGTTASEPDPLTVHVKQVDRAPVVSLAATATALSKASTTLTASASDPDADPLTYAWSQLSGPIATPSGATTGPTLTFTTPAITAAQVQAGTNVAVFKLDVSDGTLTTSAQVSLTVKDVNHPPTASAVASGSLQARTEVTLTGTGADADGDSLTSTWAQVSGPAVTLSATDRPVVTFTAPDVTTDTPMAFTFTASDAASSTPASVTFTITAVAGSGKACGCGSSTDSQLGSLALALGVVLATRRRGQR